MLEVMRMRSDERYDEETRDCGFDSAYSLGWIICDGMGKCFISSFVIICILFFQCDTKKIER